MTEQEEDEELLSDLNTAKKTVISFDESPNYIKVWSYHPVQYEIYVPYWQDGIDIYYGNTEIFIKQTILFY